MKAAEDLRISAENINNMLNNSLQKISATRKRTRKLKAVSILRKKREKKETKIEVINKIINGRHIIRNFIIP